jgi:putative transposase
MAHPLRLSELCAFFGITRQAYYKHHAVRRGQENQRLAHYELLVAVQRFRHRMPRLGARKLLYLLEQNEPALLENIGRDAFFDLLRSENLLLKPRKGYSTKTTDSRHGFRKYPDLFNDRKATLVQPFMAVVADITYIHTLEGFAYAAILTDVASRMVVGFDVSASLCVEGSLRAVQMMIKLFKHAQKQGYTLEEKPIHHSDRGVQYCCADYIRLIDHYGFLPSMTQSGEPTDNALAERVNGIFKEEFSFNTTFQSVKAVQQAFSESVLIYNTERPHLALHMKTPKQYIQQFFAP